MSITMSYRRLSLEKFEELKSSSEVAQKFFYGDDSYDNALSVYDEDFDSSATKLDIEKEWQAIHYLLTGEIGFGSDDPAPLHKVIWGGTPTEWECSYGHTRFLTTVEVQEIAQTLVQTPEAHLRANFEAHGDVEIYAQEDTWTDESDDDWETLTNAYSFIMRFFEEAAAAQQMMLLSMD